MDESFFPTDSPIADGPLRVPGSLFDLQRGITLIEVAISGVLLVVGMLTYVSTIVSTSRLSESNSAHDTLCAGLRNVVAELRTVPYHDILSVYGTNGPSQSFWLDESGSIVFSPTASVVATGEFEFFIDETSLPVEFGDNSGAFDLNADGYLTGPVADFVVLPVRVRFTVEPEYGGFSQVVNFMLGPPAS